MSSSPRPSPSAHILIPLPDRDFDPTESSTPWKVCRARGWQVTFSTERGQVAAADPRLLLGVLRGPLGAGPRARAAYAEMTRDPAYQHPIRYEDIHPDQYDGVVLTGGHAPGMKQFLDSPVLQNKLVEFWQAGKTVGAICHGVLILARAVDPATGLSILHGSKVTALTKSLERSGFLLTFWLLGRRYRTYDCYVADEVRSRLASPRDFATGPSMLAPFALRDGNLVTGRWPLDAARFSELFAQAVESKIAPPA